MKDYEHGIYHRFSWIIENLDYMSTFTIQPIPSCLFVCGLYFVQMKKFQQTHQRALCREVRGTGAVDALLTEGGAEFLVPVAKVKLVR